MGQEEFVKFDSHAHITGDALFNDVDMVIERAKEQNVQYIINIATDAITLERGIALAQKYPDMVFNTAATTPHDVEKEGESFFPHVQKAAQEGLLSAIGETGLDYYYEHSLRKLQKNFLERYFELADQMGLNVVIHCRGDEAFDDLFVIAERQQRLPHCVLHCFTGTREQAEKALSLGWLLSMSGIATFKRSEELREVIKEIPLDRLLIETDAPYLAPQSKRGERNEPSYVGEIAKIIAEVKEIDLEQVCAQIVKNAWSFFQISRRLTP